MNSDFNSPDSSPVLRARGLAKIYGEGEAAVRALAGVDLDLYAGELVVLLGPSGSGKTTLLNSLGGLDVPTSGELRYRDFELTGADEGRLTQYRRDCVGFVFQFYNLIPSLTARENVALITEIARDPMPPETALELVRLGARMDHFPAELSGGEQQRVAIARAIAKRPEMLLCDEPTGALDVRTGVAVLEAIEHVNRELGTLTVIITHNAVMADIADRVIHLSDGRVHQVRQNPRRAPVHSLHW
ncbi:MAG TPA: ABC transporter ATP-binding protein [Candidatus Paceibacterota bacterium]|nr:ABC transporter ATP-binding protein [Verrucomicrobiota bacterium]HOX01419.1 ABC transporter ATP-binding protein [Verrucomicrobiota bacterium]HRZ44458.1 ABC transporter ATP-binding protein [Candidatus Paceibacterota bacterium]